VFDDKTKELKDAKTAKTTIEGKIKKAQDDQKTAAKDYEADQLYAL